MKNIYHIVFGFTVLLLMVPTNARADFISPAGIQSGLMGAAAATDEIRTTVRMSVTIPDFPQVDPILFKTTADIPYSSSGSTYTVRGDDLPVMMAEMDDIPDSLRPMTIAMAVHEKSVKVSVKDGELDIPRVDLKVSLYNKRRYDIKPSTKPSLEMILKDVKIEIDEYDPRSQEVLLGFTSTFPKTDNELFNEFLAGKKVDADIDIAFR